MEMQELLKKVEELKIVPVVVLEDAKDKCKTQRMQFLLDRH